MPHCIIASSVATSLEICWLRPPAGSIGVRDPPIVIKVPFSSDYRGLVGQQLWGFLWVPGSQYSRHNEELFNPAGDVLDGFPWGRRWVAGVTGGGSSDEISFISTNSRSNIFLDTFAGRSAMELKGPIAWSPLWEFPIRLSAVPWLDVASWALAATSARRLRGSVGCLCLFHHQTPAMRQLAVELSFACLERGNRESGEGKWVGGNGLECLVVCTRWH